MKAARRRKGEIRAKLTYDLKMDPVASDAELVEDVRMGDAAAFEVLVRRHLPAAHGLAMSLVRDSDLADDVCQEAFISVLKCVEQLRDPGSFRYWFLSIVRNRALKLISFERQRAGPAIKDVPEPTVEAEPLSNLEWRETTQALNNALALLSATQKNVFVLHDLEGLNHREISLSLGISTGSSRVHLHMARRALRNVLDRDCLEEA